MDQTKRVRPLRRGWTTGTCAAAASRAAYQALLTGAFPDPVEVLLRDLNTAGDGLYVCDGVGGGR